MELLTTNNVWMMLCAALVFFMHLDFHFWKLVLQDRRIQLIYYLKTFYNNNGANNLLFNWIQLNVSWRF